MFVCIFQAIDELLAYNADPCLPLTHGVGSALCVASSTEYEHRRNPDNRLKLVNITLSHSSITIRYETIPSVSWY